MPPLVAGDFERLLAKIEREGDELFAGRQPDVTYHPARRNRGILGRRAFGWRYARLRGPPLHALLAPVIAEIARRPAHRRRFRGGGSDQKAEPEERHSREHRAASAEGRENATRNTKARA